MLRAISEIKPTYVVGENVRGLTNWNGGVVFEEVCTDLESQGYTVQPILLPACAVGAPHRRDRIWFVAYSKSARAGENFGGLRSEFERCNTRKKDAAFITNSNSIRQHECECDNEEQSSQRGINALNDITKNVEYGAAAYTKNIGQKHALENGELERGRFRQSNKRGFWNAFPSQSPICSGDDGLSTELDGITFPKWRAESIKGYGNAIVPQVAYEIFKVIAEMDAREKTQLKLF
jgi:DNA (cytosine-5)-methyltransferase 1